MRNISRVAVSELPPRAKKLLSRPMLAGGRLPGSSRDHSPASRCSVGEAGPARCGASPVRSGTGSAARSTFPYAVVGSRSRTVNTAGTRCAGSRAATWSRRPAGVGTTAPAGVT